MKKILMVAILSLFLGGCNNDYDPWLLENDLRAIGIDLNKPDAAELKRQAMMENYVRKVLDYKPNGSIPKEPIDIRTAKTLDEFTPVKIKGVVSTYLDGNQYMFKDWSGEMIPIIVDSVLSLDAALVTITGGMIINYDGLPAVKVFSIEKERIEK